MKVIGLVGGVASGKSTVAQWLSEQGAAVVDADRLGHEALRQPAVVGALVARWGASVRAADGQIDRAAVAAKVFGDSPEAAQERRFLEQIVHPRIRALAEAALRQAAADGRTAAVLDAPLLLEAGWDVLCDLILWIDAPADQRARRGAARGWTPAQFAAREAAQLPIDQKKARASHCLPNAGTLSELRARLTQFWEQAVLGHGGGALPPNAELPTPFGEDCLP